MALRSGRFKTTGAATITIVQPRLGAFYRILNSGDNIFKVKDSSGKSTTLGKKLSLDVVADRSIVIDSAADSEGIYDYLNTERPSRSGRFRIPNAAAKFKIIDLIGLTTTSVFYRIFNSGKKSFKLLRGISELTELLPEQSFDFEITAADRDIWVEPSVANTRIDGIYDFLGHS